MLSDAPKAKLTWPDILKIQILNLSRSIFSPHDAEDLKVS